MIDSTVFLDTGFAIALLSPRDQYHAAALRLAAEIQRQGTKVITSDAVLLEIGAALAKLTYRLAAIKLIDGLRFDSKVEVVPLDNKLFDAGYQLFRKRPDKEWSLTDCISFIIMQEQHISQALAADEHFRQAGLIPLLLQI
ncbi:MAG: PIN domain-containing protein [Candidatus Competibacteraceae bacterium]